MADHRIAIDSKGNQYLEDVPGCTMADEELRNATIIYSMGPISFTDNNQMVVDLESFKNRRIYPNGTQLEVSIFNGMVRMDTQDNRGDTFATTFIKIDEKGRPYMEETQKVYLDEIR